MFASREVRGWKALVPFQWHRDGRELPRPFSLSAPPATVRRLFILVLVASWLQGDSHSARHRIFITGRRKAPTIFVPYVWEAKLLQKPLSGLRLTSQNQHLTVQN